MKESVSELWKHLGKYKYVLIVLLAGVLLLALPKAGESRTTASTAVQTSAVEPFDLEGLERSMERALSQIDGAGDVTVVLTLRGSTRRVLAEDTRATEKESSRETVVVSQGGSVQDGLLVQEIYPQFRGALIVCAGGNDAAVRLKILDSVMALTGLSSDHISVCAGH